MRRCWPWWRWGLTGLSAAGLTLSSHLSWHYLTGGSLIGCGGGGPCDQALNSRWSSVMGVLPVSGLAVGAYLAMLVASLFVGEDTERLVRQLAWRAMIVLAGAAVGSAVWFIILQKWIMGAFCPYCMATHTIGVLLAGLLIRVAPSPSGDGAYSQRGYRHLGVAGTASIGVFLAAIIAACQIGFAPRAVYRVGESQLSFPAFDPRSAPLMGSSNAPYVVSLLFDYNCPHCQQLHLMLDETIRRYNGNLAVALCPAPLNTNCNPYVPRNVDEFANSCNLARLALAVWVAKREAFPVFDRWMFSFESGDRWRPRTLDEAKAKALELIGQEELKTALGSPWIDRYLKDCIRLYGKTALGGNNAVPKLVFQSRWIIPQSYAAEDLIAMLHESLALPSP